MDLTNISTTQLKEYTKKASEMESSVSYIQRMIWDIEAKIRALNTELTNISNRKWKVPEPPTKPVEPIEIEYPKDNSRKIMITLIALLALSLYSQFFGMGLLGIVIPLPAMILLIYLKINKYNRKECIKQIDLENQSRMAQYRADVQNYPRKMEKYNQECVDYNNACRNDASLSLLPHTCFPQ